MKLQNGCHLNGKRGKWAGRLVSAVLARACRKPRDFACEYQFREPFFGPARREDGVEIRGCIEGDAAYLSCSRRSCPKNAGGFGNRCMEESIIGVPAKLVKIAEKEIKKIARGK